MWNLASFPFLCCLFILPFLKPSFAVNSINSTQPIRDGDTLISSSQTFELGFFSPGNSKNRYLGIWYKNSPGTVAWVANRNNPVTDLNGVLTIRKDGNLVIINQKNDIIWSSNVSTVTGGLPMAQLLDSGNLVLIEQNSSTSSESYMWQSFDNPSDTLLPGMKMGRNFRSGQEKYLTSWRSTDDPSFGITINKLDINGLGQLLTTSGSVKKYRSGQWNGIFFGGVPTITNSVYQYFMVSNQEETYYTFELLNKSVLSRLTLTPSGLLERSYMYERSTEWTVIYSLPMDLCDSYGHCGANSICTIGNASVCECLKGYVPKSQGEQDLSGSTNCERKFPFCQGEEGFFKVSWIKLPDFDFRWNIENMTLKECETVCLKNCSCSAYTNLNVSGTGVCLMWFQDLIDIIEQPGALRGEDIYIRMPVSELEPVHNSSKNKRLKKILVVLLSIASAIFILGLVFCITRKKTKKKVCESKEEEVDVPLFEWATIANATNNFSQANILGEGGFGPVYKGQLLSGQEIAVKKLSNNSKQGAEEFRSEVVLIAKLQHRNLVGLLGICIQGEERMLIYEYMPNKSLNYFIFDHSRSALMAWKERLNIVLGIARGLLYLHQDSKLQIVHRDLKPSNILLDNNLDPKISDFGLARISADDQEAITKRVVGTYGYMSPEYAIDGTFSVKSDVFSLGVILLEIVSGKRNRTFTHSDHSHNLLGHAWLLWNEARALELMDTCSVDLCGHSQVLRCIQVGLLCVQKLPEDRPAMSSVVFMLENEGAMLPHPKQPGFFIEQSSGMGGEQCYTENALSLSELEAR